VAQTRRRSTGRASKATPHQERLRRLVPSRCLRLGGGRGPNPKKKSDRREDSLGRYSSGARGDAGDAAGTRRPRRVTPHNSLASARGRRIRQGRRPETIRRGGDGSLGTGTPYPRSQQYSALTESKDPRVGPAGRALGSSPRSTNLFSFFSLGFFRDFLSFLFFLFSGPGRGTSRAGRPASPGAEAEPVRIDSWLRGTPAPALELEGIR
jgi:hypothetical protein